MAILLTTPVTVPAAEYNEVWLSDFAVMARNPNDKIRVRAVLSKARTLESGKKEVMQGGDVVYMVDDFFKAAEADPELMQIMGALVTKVKALANL